MHSIPFTEVRAHLAHALREVEAAREPLLISRQGRTAGVLLSWAQYRELSAGPAGFGARLAQLRAECLQASAPADGAGQDSDPFSGLRSTDVGRPVADWAV